MLWRVHNTDKYFLGSFHLVPESHSELNVKITSLQPQMSRVVFESNLANVKEPDFSTYKNAGRLHKNLPSDLYTRCSLRWQELTIEVTLDSCKPWWAALLIAIRTAMKNGFSHERGVDRQIFDQ